MILLHFTHAQWEFVHGLEFEPHTPETDYHQAQRAASELQQGSRPRQIPHCRPGAIAGEVVPYETLRADELPVGWALFPRWDSGNHHSVSNAAEIATMLYWNSRFYQSGFRIYRMVDLALEGKREWLHSESPAS